MGKQKICPLCGNDKAWEWPISKQDKYEIRCDACTVYHLTFGPDEEFINLPKEDRMALSAYVHEQYEKKKIPVHLDWLENFKGIIDDRKSGR